MPKEIIKILGQVRPAINTEVVLYTVPANRRAIVQITVFDSSGTDANVNIAVVPDGFNDIPGNPTVPVNFLVEGVKVSTKQELAGAGVSGITLSENDDIRVESDQADCIFHCYGVEVEP